jgi:transcription initiation factor IIF auxiliary subunit
MEEKLGVAPPSVPTSYYIQARTSLSVVLAQARALIHRILLARVQRVEVFLHPTFNPNRLVLTEQPFEFARVRDVLLSCH